MHLRTPRALTVPQRLVVHLHTYPKGSYCTPETCSTPTYPKGSYCTPETCSAPTCPEGHSPTWVVAHKRDARSLSCVLSTPRPAWVWTAEGNKKGTVGMATVCICSHGDCVCAPTNSTQPASSYISPRRTALLSSSADTLTSSCSTLSSLSSVTIAVFRTVS